MKYYDFNGFPVTLNDLYEIEMRNPELAKEAEETAIQFLGSMYGLGYKDYVLAKEVMKHGFLLGANSMASKK